MLYTNQIVCVRGLPVQYWMVDFRLIDWRLIGRREYERWKTKVGRKIKKKKINQPRSFRQWINQWINESIPSPPPKLRHRTRFPFPRFSSTWDRLYCIVKTHTHTIQLNIVAYHSLSQPTKSARYVPGFLFFFLFVFLLFFFLFSFLLFATGLELVWLTGYCWGPPKMDANEIFPVRKEGGIYSIRYFKLPIRSMHLRTLGW